MTTRIRFAKFVRRLVAACGAHVASAVVVTGAALFAYGLSLYSLPLGPIAFGLALMAFVALDSDQPRRKR